MSRASKVVDPDAGPTADPAAKQAVLVDQDTKDTRDRDRASLRADDDAMAAAPGYSTAHVDSQRYMPRPTPRPVRDRRMVRQLPQPEQTRTPVTAWQRRQRLNDARDAQGATSATEIHATAQLLNDGTSWQRLNDQLSAHVGNVHELAADDEKTIRRVDRFIQRYERRNERGHVVYANCLTPAHVRSVQAFTAENFTPGEVISFDRFTAGAHCLHETEPDILDRGRVFTFEISTRRGAYMGAGQHGDNTAHLLPRGLELAVVSTHTATYTRPDGSTGTRTIVQLVDITTEEQR